MDFTTDIMVQDQRRKKWGGTVLQYREYDTEILNRIKDVEKQILCKYIEICEKYHLRYFVAFGTLLGTARHKGFIPWDDDIDVGMPREDYERFLQIAQKECGEEYFLQTVDTDPEYHLYFAKLRMNRTRFVENSLQKAGSVTGFYIDIFPYDEISDDEEEMVTVKNTGTCAGTETIQLYLHDIAASVVRPVKELKDFRKVTLQPEEEARVEFTITEPQLRFLSENNIFESEAGIFEIFIGTDSTTTNKAKFTLEKQ